MKGGGTLTCDLTSGHDMLVCDEDLNDSLPSPGPDWQQALLSRMTTSKYFRHAVVSLAVLAAILLVIDIGLGIHYNDIRGDHLTVEDSELIYNELTELQTSYKNAMESIQRAKTQVDKEKIHHMEVEWELDHQEKRSKDYEGQTNKLRKDIAALEFRLPMIKGGCSHCPAGWLLMNSQCYFFSIAEHDAYRSWQDARNFCQMQGGDLIVLDSKDKQNMTVSYLRENDPLSNWFWMGLRDVEEEGTWKWLDGTVLSEGYWRDGEPNNANVEDCAAVGRQQNFFKAWNDIRCVDTLGWICEKAQS